MTVTFGATAEPLHRQLRVLRRRLLLSQRLADAITLLSVHGLLTEGETHQARKRLVAQIAKELRATAPKGKPDVAAGWCAEG